MIKTALPALVLTAPRAGDGLGLLARVSSSVEHLSRYGDYTELVEADQAGIEALLVRTPTQTPWVMTVAGKPVGLVTLIRHAETVYGLGYWIGGEFGGQGLTGAAVAAVVDSLFRERGATEVWAGIKAANTPSIRLVTRLGFELARTQPTHLSYVKRVIERHER